MSNKVGNTWCEPEGSCGVINLLGVSQKIVTYTSFGMLVSALTSETKLRQQIVVILLKNDTFSKARTAPRAEEHTSQLPPHRRRALGCQPSPPPVGRCLSSHPLSPDASTLFVVVTQSVPGCHWVLQHPQTSSVN